MENGGLTSRVGKTLDELWSERAAAAPTGRGKGKGRDREPAAGKGKAKGRSKGLGAGRWAPVPASGASVGPSWGKGGKGGRSLGRGRGPGRGFAAKGRGKGRGKTLSVIRTIGDKRKGRGKGKGGVPVPTFGRAKGYGKGYAQGYGSAAKGRWKGRGMGPAMPALGNGDEPTALFFANVPWEVRVKELREVFEEVGPVDRVFLFQDQDGRGRGMGLVHYPSWRLANEALRSLHGLLIGDRRLYLQEDTSQYADAGSGAGGRAQDLALRGGHAGYGPVRRAPGQGRQRAPPYASGRTVFFANASFDTSTADLTKHFEAAGPLSKFALFTLPDGASRGMGVCEYRSAEAAELAYNELHNSTVDGRPLLVDRYMPPEEP